MEDDIHVQDDTGETGARVIDTGRVVKGFIFTTPEDAEKARIDVQKIAFLKSRFKTGKPEHQRAIYEKAIENRIFRTPVGWNYLESLRQTLIENGIDESELTPIPVDVVITRTPLADDYIPKQRIKPAPPKRDIHYMTILSVAINIILAVLVVVMFLIAYYSDTDNIINYKENVTNRYAEWQQELMEREKELRKKERELGIAIQEDTADRSGESEE